MKTYKVIKEFSFYDDTLKKEFLFEIGDIIKIDYDYNNNNSMMTISKGTLTCKGLSFNISEYVENHSHVQLKYGSREDINYFLSTIPNDNFISLTKEKRNRYLLIYIED